MTRPSAHRLPVRRSLGAGLAVLTVVALGACGSTGDYPATVVPSTSTTSATAAPVTAAPTCSPSAVTSYAPVAAITPATQAAAIAALPPLASQKTRTYLTVGISADSLLLGSRNPLTGQIEGFDIDMAKAVAKALFGDESKIRLVVITSADRIPALQSGRVDMVARAFSMTCARWKDIAFSAEYYQAGLKLLVPDDTAGRKVTGFAQLTGQKVCAPTGTSTLAKVQEQSGVEAVGAPTHTACLVLFQQGKVDAIAGDDTVLAGLAAQDPYAFVPKISNGVPPTGTALTSEPYGLGIKKGSVALVAFTNKVLADMKADGRWKASYDKWFAAPLGPAPAPPAAVYGRS